MTILRVSPSVLVRRLQQGRLTQSLGANPWWDPLGEGLCVWSAYQPKGAADLASSYLDLSGNGNNAGVGVAPTWDGVNGWTFNGTNQYLTTTFVPQADQSQSVLIRYTTASTLFRYLFGIYEGGNKRFNIVPNTGGTAIYMNGNGQLAQAPGLLVGNLGIAGNTGYRNGIADATPLPTYTAGAATESCAIGCVNVSTPGGYIACTMQAFVLYECELTAPQMLAVYTAMAAL